MTPTTSETQGQAQIRGLIDDRAKAAHAKDINSSMSNHAPDVLIFDVVNPLR